MESYDEKKPHSWLQFGIAELGIIIILTLILLIIFNYFQIIPFSKYYPNIFGWLPSQQQNTVKTNTPAPQTLSPTPSQLTSAKFPILPEDPLVHKTYIFYELRGVITGVKIEQKKRFIMLNNRETVLYSVPITEKTPIEKVKNFERNKSVVGSNADISENKLVSIFLHYDLETKLWTIDKISLIEGGLSSPSPTP